MKKIPKDKTKSHPPKNRVFRLIGRSIFILFIFTFFQVLFLRWIPPLASFMMIENFFHTLWTDKKAAPIHYKWTGWISISPYMPLAVIAAEDQKFPFHWGLDIKAISKAVEKNKKGKRLRGASTITQQLAKNLFLWSGKTYFRKGLEVYYAMLIELLWPKERILEVYLNIAMFGDGIYGVRMASSLLLNKSPSNLTRRDAALLSSVLPNPKRFQVKKPSLYVLERVRWIERQMGRLGGVAYLKYI